MTHTVVAVLILALSLQPFQEVEAASLRGEFKCCLDGLLGWKPFTGHGIGGSISLMFLLLAIGLLVMRLRLSLSLGFGLLPLTNLFLVGTQAFLILLAKGFLFVGPVLVRPMLFLVLLAVLQKLKGRLFGFELKTGQAHG